MNLTMLERRRGGFLFSRCCDLLESKMFPAHERESGRLLDCGWDEIAHYCTVISTRLEVQRSGQVSS